MMKRSFTAIDGEGTIAVKRARKYLGSDENQEIVESPFFSKKPTTGVNKAPHLSSDAIDEARLEMDLELPVKVIGEEIVDKPMNEMMKTTEDRQVSESPPRTKPTETSQRDEDYVIPDSPANATRTKPLLTPPEIPDDADEIIHACPSNNKNIFPPSPPPSRPTPIFPLSSNHTPILRPGMKKPYAPRPSHQRTIFPDTPTPLPAHTTIIQGWKKQFVHTNTISNRPITPLHTTVFQRKRVNHGIVRPVSSVEARDVVTPISSRLALVEQIQDSPPRRDGKAICLDRFRFTPQ
jgi:hypothetical protein